MGGIHYLMIGLGGAIGAIARVALSRLLPPALWGIPLPILLVNVLGCIIMGILIEYMALHWSPQENTRAFLISGVLGGFTTFSTFALEWGLLSEKNMHTPAMAYVAFSVILSLLGFWCGMKIVRIF